MRHTPNDEVDDWIDQLLEANPLTIYIGDDVEEPVGLHRPKASWTLHSSSSSNGNRRMTLATQRSRCAGDAYRPTTSIDRGLQDCKERIAFASQHYLIICLYRSETV